METVEGSRDTRGDEDAIAPEKTRLDLDWARIGSALAERCETAHGVANARAILPLATHEEALVAIREASEAMEAMAEGEPLPLPPLPDARAAHARAAHGGVLSANELRDVAEVLGAARTLRRYLHSRRERLPALFEACSTDPALDELEENIARCFDPDGTLSDRASPRLRELRGEHLASRGRMIARIEEIQRRYSAILQDDYWTEREGRYVLPVRSDAHERFPGIVHASSASGATLFVEPRALIPLGNRLKMLEGEVRREEEQVLAQLTGRVLEAIGSVGFALEAIARADLRAATAKLARELSLRFPELPDGKDADFVADLRALRHPVLAIEAFESRGERKVVPSDVRIAAGHALVVSGPNAGGKTVALKALGLAALMLRSGLPIAAAEGSVLGLVEVVLTDVGDDQSLQKSLSTFSAHVVNLVRTLDAARPGALVLLDELAGGTDPREGEALATAVLDGLCRRGAAVVATTHYEGLKAMALGDPRFANASVGFDRETLTPTFRLSLGIPGASSALAVARRFGIPSTVIERAEAYLTGDSRNFEETVRALNDERRALEMARDAAEAEAYAARELRKSLENEREALRARDKRILEQEAEQIFQSLRRTREELRSVQARLRASKKPELAQVTADAKALDAVAGRFAIGGDLESLVDAQATSRAARGEEVSDATPLRKGARVWVPRLRAEAEVIDVLSDGQLRVGAGALKLVVGRADVRVLSDAGGAGGRPKGGRGIRLQSSHGRSMQGPAARSEGHLADGEGTAVGASAAPELALQTSDNTVDVRGMRVDDAMPMVETFLDRCLNGGQRSAFVVHGHGSGALREAIREELRRSRYVERFRPGGPREGGDGVTIVYLT
jgi:DNA mismatch repair protein MutS2